MVGEQVDLPDLTGISLLWRIIELIAGCVQWSEPGASGAREEDHVNTQTNKTWKRDKQTREALRTKGKGQHKERLESFENTAMASASVQVLKDTMGWHSGWAQ